MAPKNIFDLHKDILTDYKLYIDSFINIADAKILETVKKDFDSGNLYPEPLIQFNPSFESGGKVEDLVNTGTLVRDFNNLFMMKKVIPGQFISIRGGYNQG
jgi:hypothetical protein